VPIPALSDLLGQPEASVFLSGVVARARYANAYLFQGPAGVGKGTAALAFARAVLCDRSGGAPPCGRCPACLKSARLQHPDLKFLFPVSGEEKDLDETIAATLAAWREDPLFVFSYEKAASIRLSITRDLLRELAFKPFEAQRRVVVVRDADRMREDQYSAMLKAIEEPGASSLWVLTTARPSRLPATIRSRCQKVRFAPLPEDLIADFLSERAGITARPARMLAALSGGSLARALTLREQDPLALRNQALALLEPALRGDPATLWKTLGRLGRPGRETIRRLVEFHQLWLRDILRARYGAPRESLVHRDREEEIRKQAQTLDATEIRRRLMVLEEVLRAMESNVAVEVALFSALTRLADRSLETDSWPPHPTDRWAY